MASVSIVKALTNFFNVGDGKVPAKEWMGELKALTPAEKQGLAEMVVAATGDTLVLPVTK